MNTSGSQDIVTRIIGPRVGPPHSPKDFSFVPTDLPPPPDFELDLRPSQLVIVIESRLRNSYFESGWFHANQGLKCIHCMRIDLCNAEVTEPLSPTLSSAEALFFVRLIEDVRTFALGLPMRCTRVVDGCS